MRKRSQNLLEKQIEEQKSLIKKLELGNIDEKQKRSIMEAIKLLQDSIEKIKKDLLAITKPVKKVVPVKRTKEEVSTVKNVFFCGAVSFQLDLVILPQHKKICCYKESVFISRSSYVALIVINV